jgi:hypothetical protein
MIRWVVSCKVRKEIEQVQNRNEAEFKRRNSKKSSHRCLTTISPTRPYSSHKVPNSNASTIISVCSRQRRGDFSSRLPGGEVHLKIQKELFPKAGIHVIAALTWGTNLVRCKPVMLAQDNQLYMDQVRIWLVESGRPGSVQLQEWSSLVSTAREFLQGMNGTAAVDTFEMKHPSHTSY